MTAPKTSEEKAKLKQERAIDGAQAMVEYRAAEQAERTRLTWLRGERLAREAAAPAKSRINSKIKTENLPRLDIVSEPRPRRKRSKSLASGR